MNNQIVNNFKIYKNIPVLILNKDDIVFINDKAKKILKYSSKIKNDLLEKLLFSIKNKTNKLELSVSGKNIYTTFQYEEFSENRKKHYVCFLNENSTSDINVEEIKNKLELYQEIFHNLPIGIIIHDFGKIKYINKYGIKVIEAKNKKQYLNFNILNFLTSERDKQRAIRRIQSRENLVKPEIYEIQTFQKHKKIVELYSYLFDNIEKESSIIRLLVFIDKTSEIEKQQLEIEAQIKQHENKILKAQNQIKEKLLKELRFKQEQLLNTINNSDYLFWILDTNLNFLIFNHAFYQYCFKYYNFKVSVGDNLENIYQANETEKQVLLERRKFLSNVIQSKKEITHEIIHYDKDQKKNRIFKVTMKPILGKNKKIEYFYCYGHEITEKYEYIHQIEHQTVKLQEVVEHSPIYLWSMNKNQEITLFNKNYEQLVEKLYGEKPVIGKKLSKGKYAENKEIVSTLNYHYQKALSGSQENFKLTFDIDDKNKITLDVNVFPIIVNNEIKEVAGIATDITQEIQKQQQLEVLLQENEVLMKEIHHRIKNNLQVISSMINIQLQEENETHTKNILRDTQNRVLSMAMIHQTLYQNKNYSSINISNTILQLIQNVLYSFNQTDMDVQTNIEDIVIDVNTAIPISLLLNEALTNVVKYAFPPHFKKVKKIEITLKRNLEHLLLIIKDNGIGIPEQILENSNSVGFSIIRALSEQMNAELFINSKPNQGTEIKVLIPQL